MIIRNTEIIALGKMLIFLNFKAGCPCASRHALKN